MCSLFKSNNNKKKDTVYIMCGDTEKDMLGALGVRVGEEKPWEKRLPSGNKKKKKLIIFVYPLFSSTLNPLFSLIFFLFD